MRLPHREGVLRMNKLPIINENTLISDICGLFLAVCCVRSMQPRLEVVMFV
jgi:hypothetical protein